MASTSKVSGGPPEPRSIPGFGIIVERPPVWGTESTGRYHRRLTVKSFLARIAEWLAR